MKIDTESKYIDMVKALRSHRQLDDLQPSSLTSSLGSNITFLLIQHLVASGFKIRLVPMFPAPRIFNFSLLTFHF